jgi:hypothetical protein
MKSIPSTWIFGSILCPLFDSFGVIAGNALKTIPLQVPHKLFFRKFCLLLKCCSPMGSQILDRSLQIREFQPPSIHVQQIDVFGICLSCPTSCIHRSC